MKPSTQTILLSSLDQDARDWSARVAAAGGSVGGNTRKAVSEFCKRAKAAGYWSKINRVNLFCGNQLAAALVPLKVGGGGATDTNVAFVAGDYAETTGLTGNGTTQYLRTGWIPSASLTLNSTHMAVYNRAAAMAGGNIHIGTRDGTNYLELYAPFSTGNFGWRSYGLVEIFSAVSAPYGLMVGSTISAADTKTYQHGTQRQTGSPSAGALVPNEVYVFGTNNSGAVASATSHALGGYSVGIGLTAADVTAYTTHMEAFQDALGRGVQ
jgi:hypothetical protein